MPWFVISLASLWFGPALVALAAEEAARFTLRHGPTPR